MACSIANRDYEFTAVFYHRGPGCPETYTFTVLDEPIQAADDYIYKLFAAFDSGIPCADAPANAWVNPDGLCWENPDGLYWEFVP